MDYEGVQTSEVEQLMSVDVQALHQPFMKKHCCVVTMPMDFTSSTQKMKGLNATAHSDVIHTK